VASTIVTCQTVSPITANARGWSQAPAPGRRWAASFMAVMDHWSALAPTAGSPAFSAFHAIRQRAEQNRACSRRGANGAPH